jgi:N,N-dimethylformamidase
VAAVTDWARLVGYAERLSVAPGERLRVMASCESPPSARVVSLPDREPAAVAVRELEPVGPRAVRAGAHVVVPHDPALRPDDGLVVSTWLWLAPGAPAGSRRALLSTWSDGGDGWALVLDAHGRPCFEVGAGGRRAQVAGERAIERGIWARLEAELDPATETIAITHRRRRGRRLETVESARAPSAVGGPGQGPGPLLLGAEADAEGLAVSHLDGKLDRPGVASGTGGETTVAAWHLGEGRGARVLDGGPRGLHGLCVNGPLRAVTGHDWRGDVHDWRLAPEQYGAMHFHADAVDDLGWPPSFELEPPADLPGGVYGLLLEADGVEDLVTFAVRRAAGAEPAANVLVLPTFTYLAYSCERETPAATGSDRPEDRWVAEAGLRCLYDRHADGVGVYEASLLRPLTQLRPGYRCSQHGGPHGLAQDLILIGWLRRRGIAVDLLTDHDVHREGAAALAGHRTLITGAHPEYASAALLDAIDQHLEAGGSLAYLGGNGLNGSVSVDPARPHVIELRRCETQTLMWQALPGEHHHASGEYGGDWRRRARPEHRTLGVGLRAFGEGPAAAYARSESNDPAAAIAFDGIDPRAEIGAAGEVLGGAAGYEVDGYDPRLGSPAEAVVLATARVGDAYAPWPDDVVDDPGGGGPLRADLVLHRRPEGGAVFAVGSIAWTGCLAGDDDNPVARVTENALAELARDAPFRERADG